MVDLLSPFDVEEIARSNGRTMAQVCRAAGVAPSTFSRWRAGKTSPSIDVYQNLLRCAGDIRPSEVGALKEAKGTME